MLNGRTSQSSTADAEANGLIARIEAASAGAGLVPERESSLAAEIAALLQNPPMRGQPPAATAPDQDDAEAFDSGTTRLIGKIGASPETGARSASAPASAVRSAGGLPTSADRGFARAPALIDHADLDDLELAASEAALPPRAAAWVRKARRQRAVQALRRTASWGVSVLVTVLVIVAAAWAIAGFPTDFNVLRSLAEQALDVG